MNYQWEKIFILFLLLSACSKDSIKEPITQEIELSYQKFLGSYRVLNSDSGVFYNMTISYFKGIDQYGDKYDGLLLQNFANKFNLTINYVENSIDPSILSVGTHHPVCDYYGNRWHLSSIGDTIQYANFLMNDTLKFYFNLCNIAWYIYDGQPYYCKDVWHIAVKQ